MTTCDHGVTYPGRIPESAMRFRCLHIGGQVPEIPVGYANVHFVFNLTGDPEDMVFQLGCRSSVGTTRADLELAVEEMASDWRDAFIPTAASMYVGWSFFGVRGDLNSSDEGLVQFESADAGMTGTAVGETPPVNTAILVRKYTGFGGRKNRGRVFVPPWGVSEGLISKLGVLDNTFRAAHQAAWTAFRVAALGHDAPPVLLHAEGSVEPPRDITSFSVQTQVATQRRRLRH
jgi:hypothetical protein